MSTISNLIFGGKDHKMSSPFGKRAVISTSAGNTSSFHNGTDYSTSGKKLTQYAIADGVIDSCGVDSAYGGAKFVWVSYPSLKVKMLHYHLDSIKVVKGQKVTKGTALGTTGKTGKATGVHLHLGIKHIGNNEWIDPEKWSENEYPVLITKATTYKVHTPALNVRDYPSPEKGKIVAVVHSGDKLAITEIKGEWGKFGKGWVCLKYCKIA